MNDRLTLYNARRDLDRERSKRRSKERLKPLPSHREEAERQGSCRHCGARGWIEAHHIVHRGKLPKHIDPEIRDAKANCMALCRDCHVGYHAGRIKFRRSMLTSSEVAYIIEHAGKAWLDKVYPERDERPEKDRVRDGRGRTAAPSVGSREAKAAARAKAIDEARAAQAERQEGH